MVDFNKPMAVALTMSAIFIVLNIIAVTTGSADAFYLQIDQFIKELV